MIYVLFSHWHIQYYHRICCLINTWLWQLQENEMLRRMSLLGLVVIPTFVSVLNIIIVFLF
jgi:hypothetical protein